MMRTGYQQTSLPTQLGDLPA